LPAVPRGTLVFSDFRRGYAVFPPSIRAAEFVTIPRQLLREITRDDANISFFQERYIGWPMEEEEGGIDRVTIVISIDRDSRRSMSNRANGDSLSISRRKRGTLLLIRACPKRDEFVEEIHKQPLLRISRVAELRNSDSGKRKF